MSREYFESTGKLTPGATSKIRSIGRVIYQVSWGKDCWQQLIDSDKNLQTLFLSINSVEDTDENRIYQLFIWRFALSFGIKSPNSVRSTGK